MSRNAVKRAVYGKLSGDSTLTNLLGTPASGYAKSIYFEQAPQGAQFPYVIFSRSAGTPRWTFKQEAFREDVWMVKGVDRQSATSNTADTAESIADRVEALLTDASLSISGEGLMWLRPESTVDYAEVVDGVTFRHSGSDFRLIHQPS